ncbi:MAG: hypothetical protein LBG27_09860 [Spirochaetaceae bacterium]|jgi:hypothetical protein|nr:hypothetical protein [Spirochaetaceae bacterium]
MAQTPEEFWDQYETSLGEKVVSHALGRYLGGWDEYDPPLWGLLIVTDRSFRFHHFAHDNWLTSWLSRGEGTGKERIIVIPAEEITGVRFSGGPKPWWKKIFAYRPPVLAVSYRKDGALESEHRKKGTLHVETGSDEQPFVDALTALTGIRITNRE